MVWDAIPLMGRHGNGFTPLTFQYSNSFLELCIQSFLFSRWLGFRPCQYTKLHQAVPQTVCHLEIGDFSYDTEHVSLWEIVNMYYWLLRLILYSACAAEHIFSSPFHFHGITGYWISNQMHSKVWDEMTYLFTDLLPKCNRPLRFGNG